MISEIFLHFSRYISWS